ncbi:cytidine deaminase [Nocardioides anomalus]|uniref:Cytidine deaminase n=1 Tax=Nocardioides anomalus TaxID=2712223 RepID=A0A6G6WBG9_9ACTN|nr:cytidine deaminase [Nocardioides anomalus]QIG42691.1 cytidine deaminase [Nocardioides anomalus]
MSADAEALVAAATALVEAAADGAVHTVAAAGLTVGGRVVTGLNLSHFTGGPCSELVVLANAAAAGDGRLVLVVAVGNRGRGVIAPCGRCRQVLLDLQPDVAVLVPDAGGATRAVPVRELLPEAYEWQVQRAPAGERRAEPTS